MISKTLFALAAVVVGVQASPVPKPQGVTALISPSAAIPTQCDVSYDGLFAIAAIKAEGVPIPTALAAKFKRAVVTQTADGQAAVGTSAAQVVTQLSDAQPGVGTSTVNVITQIGDAQPQAPTATVVSQISDGQVQAPSTHTTMWHTAMSQIGDGQVQAWYSVPVVTQIGDAQPQAPVATATPVSQISDAQPQAASTSTGAAVSQQSDAQPTASASATGTSTGSAAAPSVSMVACKTNSTLELDLSNGYLKDGKGRIGYIASNYQFQFDAGVPQAGAIYTAGFSVCENGTLALGGSAVFWQCLSGTFYNLYDRYWAPQCSPVFLRVVGLKDC